MAQGYAEDPAMARHFPYAAHAQVLRDHPCFDWQAVIDLSPEALAAARDVWNVPHVGTEASAMGSTTEKIEVAILATGPDARLGLLDRFPRLRAVIVEKPLGRDLRDAQAFLAECRARGIMVQVNLWRRADEHFRELARGQLTRQLGEVQAATCYYGNGLMNNGTHMIDFARMLFGEVAAVQLIGPDTGLVEGPLNGDRNPHFALWMQSGITVDYQPLRFGWYRENGIMIWGEKGRIDILAEGLIIQQFERTAHRAMLGEYEVEIDAPHRIESSAGSALYGMFENLAQALELDDATILASPGESALETSRIVELVRDLTLAEPQRSAAI